MNKMLSKQEALTKAAKGLKVAIVGGSIAGCATAIELSRAGCDVVVYERTVDGLQDRGAAIGMPASMSEMLQMRDLVDTDWAHIPVSKKSYIRPLHEGEEGDQGEHILGELSQSLRVTNWGVLYDNLRRRVPDDIYHQGQQVMALDELADGSVRLHLADGQADLFDLAIFADGYHSLGRQLLFPDLSLEYTGYIAWRGVIAEAFVSDIQPFEGRMRMVVSPAGHCLLGMMPSRQHEVETGKRRLNWLFYVKVAETDLSTVLTDKRGRTHQASVPPGAVPKAQVVDLQRTARRHLPGYIADVICNTPEPFIQAIFDMWVPCYHRGRVCLIGDAAMLARPHTGRGATKAITDAIALADALTTHQSVDTALAAWDKGQRSAGETLVTLGQSLGRALVTEAPDWQRIDDTAWQAWWAVISGTRGATLPTTWRT